MFGDRNPEQLAAWRRRGTERWQQNRRERPARRKRRKTIPRKIRELVAARSDGLCVACLARGGWRPRRGTQIHHVLDAQIWPALELDADNMVLVCVDCHANHTGAASRIPRPALPDCALRLILKTGGRALDHLENFYPAEKQNGPDGSRAVPGASGGQS